MFGYWSSFIPNSPMIGGPSNSSTLFTSIMKDPVPKVCIFENNFKIVLQLSLFSHIQGIVAFSDVFMHT